MNLPTPTQLFNRLIDKPWEGLRITRSHLSLVLLFCSAIPALASFSIRPDSLKMEEREGQWCVIHRVEQGETLYSISRRYHIPIATIKEANPELTGYGIQIDQVLVIPSSAASGEVPSSVDLEQRPVSNASPVAAPSPTILPGSPAITATTGTAAASARPATTSSEQLESPESSATAFNSPQEGIKEESARSGTEPETLSEELLTLSPQNPAAGLPDVFWHVLEPGETLFALSKRYQVPLQNLLAANPGLDAQGLKEGMRLCIPDRASAGTPALVVDQAPIQNPVNPPTELTALSPEEVPGQKPMYHVVAPGETLYSISKTYLAGSVEQIVDWNQLADNQLKTGQRLIVGWSGAGEQNSLLEESGSPLSTISETTLTSGIGASIDPTPYTSSDLKRTNETIKSRGIATWIDATSPESEANSMLALHNDAPIGSIIEVRNLMNNRVVRAKVVGRLPQNAEDSRAIVKLSQGAARQLQAHDPKVLVEVLFNPDSDLK